MERNQFWIGFETFEDLLRSRSIPQEELYLSSSIETVPSVSHPSIARVSFRIIAGRLSQDRGRCFYWRLLAGELTAYAGERDFDRINKFDRRTESALRILSAEAAANNFDVVKGVVSAPVGLQLVDGHTKLIRYHPATDRFVKDLPLVMPFIPKEAA